MPRSHFCLQCGFMLASSEANPAPVEVAPLAPVTPIPEVSAPKMSAPEIPQAIEEPIARAPQDEQLVDLVLIRSPELKEVRFKVRDQAQIGRTHGNLVFREDPYISPLHATLFYRGEQLFIRDEGSFNGVFKRIKSPVKLELGEVFVAGEQSYMIEEYGAGGSFLEQLEEGVRFFANPKPTSEVVRLTQLLDGGGRGLCAAFSDGSLTIGRQGCDLNFPLDRFMSSRHCHLSVQGHDYTLTDMGSRNGTFVGVKGEAPLSVGDFLLIGKQLLQVQPHATHSESHISV
jgi:pSer/pThr/pTyr-binding forkhead associated (FHA) protein